MKKHWQIVFKSSLVFVLLILIAGCESNSPKAIKDYDEAVQINTPDVVESLAEVKVAEWQNYSENGLNFSYPTDWLVDVKKSASSNMHYVRVQNTDKQIVVGSILPDHYYLDNELNVNDSEYSTEFIMFIVEVYPDLRLTDWQDIWQTLYPDVVEDFDSYQVPGRSDLQAVKPTKLSGLMQGELGFAVKTNSTVYYVTMYAKGFDPNETNKLFNEFLLRFSF